MSRLARFLGTAVLLGMVALLPSCGGGGGGVGGGGAPPFEMAYVLEESNSNSQGQVQYFPMNPGNGSFYPDSGASPVPTGGTVPISLLADPANNNFLYVLNNNNTAVDGTALGSVQGFSAAGYQKTMRPVGSLTNTGPNPVSMAIDPGGHYLVVADHGNGSSSCSSSSPCGDVEVFTISSGIITLLGTVSSPNLCKNPFRVVFAPGATGSSSDTVIVACSSPEIWGQKDNPGVGVYACTIEKIQSSSCGSDLISSTNKSFGQNVALIDFALVNFLFVPGTSIAVGPVLSGSSGSSGGYPTAYLLVCDFSTVSSESCSSRLSTIDSSSPGFLPSGNVAFSGSGSSATLYVGNYYPSVSGSSSSFTPSTSFEFYSCSPFSTSTSVPCSSSPIAVKSSTPGPIFFFVTGSTLYIAATKTPINGSYTGSGTSTSAGTTSGASAPSSGTLYACPLSSLSSSASCSPQTTGGWPVSIASDPQTGNYLFVATLSGTVNLYSGASTGNLSPQPGPGIAQGYLPLSVLVLP